MFMVMGCPAECGFPKMQTNEQRRMWIMVKLQKLKDKVNYDQYYSPVRRARLSSLSLQQIILGLTILALQD